MFFDWTYIAFGIALFITVFSRVRFMAALNKAAYACAKSLKAGAIADELIKNSSIDTVTVRSGAIRAAGRYVPENKTLILSTKIFDNTSVAAVTLAGYEAGRVIQYERKYFPLIMKKTLAPLINMLSWAGLIGMTVSTIMQISEFIHWSCLLFAASVLLSMMMLPPEFDTSYLISLIFKKRAYFDAKEYAHAKNVFSARAFLLPVLRICNPKSL